MKRKNKTYPPAINKLFKDTRKFFDQFLALPREEKLQVVELFRSYLANDTNLHPNSRKFYETIIECMQMALDQLP